MPFDGFISYSHAADGRLAPAVQRGLHRLAKPWHRRRALWIFRDQTGLSVTPKLWTSIQEALDGSKHFVLLASPEAARSPWVNREIEHWLATKSADRILPVVTDGEWSWDPVTRDFTTGSTAVPDALRGVFAEEPLYLDLRWARDDVQLSLQHVRFRDAIAQLAAPMHGVSKDELEGEDVRQHRRARRLSAVAAMALVLLTLAASLSGIVAVRNADRATAAAVEARLQQQEASQQRSTAQKATEESHRQQENARVQQANARVQENRAEAAGAETRRQERLADVQRALAEDAAAEADREQANARRYRENAEREQANAERQREAAEDAGEEAERQRANAERQLANARRQQELANQAEQRATEQKRIAEEHRELARKADAERRRQEELAREAREDARRQREEIARQERILINRRLIGRARAMLADDPRKALMLGVAAQRLHSDAQTRDQLSHLAMATQYSGVLADVTEVAPVAGPAVATVDAGGSVALWKIADPVAPVRLAALPVGSAPDRKLAASPDGRRLAVFDGRSPVTIWDLTDPARPRRAATLTDAAGITAVALSPDGRTVAASTRENNTVLWDIGGAEPAALSTLTGAWPLRFGPTGKTALTSGKTVNLWNLADPAHPVKGVVLKPSFADPPPGAIIQYNPALPMAAVGSNGGQNVWLWDLTDPAKPVASQLAGADGGGAVTTVEFSPDGHQMALGDADGTTGVWAVDNDTWQSVSTEIALVRAPGGPVRSAAFSRDGRTLTTAGHRQTATLWSLRGRYARDAAGTIPGPFPGALTDLAFRADGRSLLAVGQEGSAVSWNVADPAAPVRGDALPLGGPADAATLSRDGRTLAVTGPDKAVRLVDTTGRPGAEPLATLKEDGDIVRTLAFSADGSTLAVGRRDGRLSLWDVADRRQPVRISGVTLRTVSAVAFAPDGKTMAVTEGYTLSMWDLADRAAPARLVSLSLPDSVGTTGVNGDALTFSPDGRTLAAGTDLSATVLMWDVADPAHPLRTATLAAHTAAVRSVAFSPDGRSLVSASVDNAMMIWDVADPASPVRYALMKTPELETFTAAFSPDGRTLAVGGTYAGPSGNVTLWDAGVPRGLAADPAGHACAIAGRGLTPDEWARYIPELSHQPTC